jgi:phage tail sheath protein FI
MPFQLSPGVAVVEKDFSSIVPAVSSSVGAFAGSFAWGPVLEPITISSENVLVQQFGKPNDSNFQSFFAAANFLSYTNNLLLVRADSTNGKNAVATLTGGLATLTINGGGAGSGYSSTSAAPAVTIATPSVLGGVQATATTTLSGGAISAIAVSNGGTNYSSGVTVTITPAAGDTGLGASATATVASGVITGFSITGGSGFKAVPTVAIVKPANVTPTATGVSGETTVTVSSSSGIFVGMTVTGTGIAAGAKVASLASSVVTLTIANSGAVTGSLTFADAGTGAVLGTPTVGPSTVTGITITNAGTGYSSAPIVNIAPPPAGGTTAAATATVTTGGIKIRNGSEYLANYVNGNGVVGEFAAKYPGDLGNALKVSYADSATYAAWAYKAEFDSAPGTSPWVASVSGSNDEMHIVVVDSTGEWTGTPGTILEKFAFVSKASDAKKSDGTGNHYKNVLNTMSNYVWWMDYPATGATNWGTASANTTFTSLSTDATIQFVGGVDDFTMTEGQQQTAYSLLGNAELYDVSLIICGKASATTARVIADIADTRKDCVAFMSPQDVSSGDAIIGNTSTETAKVIAYRNAVNVIHSYAVIDSGYKYQYDRYNDKYRYVALNADTAGLCARTDYTNDPWFSPGGYNRGQIKNVVRLAYNPDKTERDTLYKAGVNPVVSFPGQGIILYGDKTMQTKPSAFDRINVRRLFIVLEKAIASAAKFQLFEFNDGFTRAQFKNLVEPFLRDVQGRRGIVDFRVKCDDTNNTGEVIDRNEFVADIFIKPNRSINFITLNFVAARSAANFSEIGG